MATAREQIAAVVHFGRWMDGRAVTVDEAGWSNVTIIVVAPNDDQLELGRLTEAQLRPDGGYTSGSTCCGWEKSQRGRLPFLPFKSISMQNPRAAASGYLFISAKTSTAIPARSVLLRDALIEASLDPKISSIDYTASARVALASVKLCAIVIVIHDGRYVLDFVESRPLRDIDADGLADRAARPRLERAHDHPRRQGGCGGRPVLDANSAEAFHSSDQIVSYLAIDSAVTQWLVLTTADPSEFRGSPRRGSLPP